MAGLTVVVARSFAPSAPRRVSSPTADVANAIRSFSASHPGVYAMGDRAGVVAFLLPHPLVQLEGIVSDPALLASFSAQRDFIDVLDEMSVDYDIATNPKRDGGRWQVREPSAPGLYGPRMTAFIEGEPLLRHEGIVTTMVFDVGWEASH